MRTTLDLPDDLMRSIKVQAAQRDATLTETIATLLRSALAEGDGPSTARRVQFPLVRGARQATADELSPERVFEIDSAYDVAATDEEP